MSETPIQQPEAFPESHSCVILQGAAGDIDALTDVPEDNDLGATAIVCHTLSQDCGSMHSKVVHMLERALREMGLRTVRFNFRGVGQSAGEYDQGFGESEDLLAVANWISRVRPQDEIWLGGVGFGCYVTARAAQKLPLRHLISIAPPVEDYDFKSLPRPPCPWLVVQGDSDERINPDAVYSWVEDMEDPPQLIRMEDADHLFHRRLMDLRGVVKNGIRRQRKAFTDPA